jgi:hypothetical protein
MERTGSTTSTPPTHTLIYDTFESSEKQWRLTYHVALMSKRAGAEFVSIPFACQYEEKKNHTLALHGSSTCYECQISETLAHVSEKPRLT